MLTATLISLADSSTMWRDMFHLSLPWVEKVVRPMLVYVALIVGLRLAGKRELAQLNPFDFVVLMTLSNTVQNAIIGDDNTVLGGLIGAATLLIVNYGVVRFVRHNKRLQRFIEGRPDVLIWHGQVKEHNLDREMISRADLTAAAHKQGIASLKDVERCVLEPTGTITFIEKEPTHESARHRELIELLAHIRDDLSRLHEQRPGSPEAKQTLRDAEKALGAASEVGAQPMRK